ncbi:MAG: hypothetical protein HXL68_09315 [Dechloromonas agitata]|uniref:Uncharacterized protein n=1 Tax=Dechloromonas agitata TaxID=73030 RepID=A0A930BSE0_9RHOO|nr:hypothetical protein [Dechloromonas agitata]
MGGHHCPGGVRLPELSLWSSAFSVRPGMPALFVEKCPEGGCFDFITDFGSLGVNFVKILSWKIAFQRKGAEKIERLAERHETQRPRMAGWKIFPCASPLK